MPRPERDLSEMTVGELMEHQDRRIAVLSARAAELEAVQDKLVASIAKLHEDRANLVAALRACAREMFSCESGMRDKGARHVHNERIGQAHANARTLLRELTGDE
jgi:hypothetical protein